ncbi:MAG: hypothetical protein CMA08_02250 [Euryarchaeota archaeon]|nr:hypothetical protein [Euryarchaeota archaeon]OUX22634.1 MAG: hypothetical protein CBE12_01685 [Euryarchaeota archaeon TMED252]
MVDEPLSLSARIHALDTEGMFDHVGGFVDDLAAAFDAVNEHTCPWLDHLRQRSWAGLLCLGMGGSAAGGSFLSALVDHEGALPVISHADAELPRWVTSDWLVLATSYSGNTAETLMATRAAIAEGLSVVVLATGGELAGLAETHDHVHLIGAPGGQPPRSAFGHIFGRQVALLRALGALPAGQDQHEMLDRLRTASALHDPREGQEGGVEALAEALLDRTVALLGPSELAPVLTRFKNQINENAGRFARVGVVPEMNHNEIVAWGGTGDVADPAVADQAFLLLTWAGVQPQVRARTTWMVQHLDTEAAWQLAGEGSSLLEAMLYHCIVMDWLTVTLALLAGKDPTSIGPISSLKAFLAAQH